MRDRVSAAPCGSKWTVTYRGQLLATASNAVSIQVTTKPQSTFPGRRFG